MQDYYLLMCFLGSFLGHLIADLTEWLWKKRKEKR